MLNKRIDDKQTKKAIKESQNEQQTDKKITDLLEFKLIESIQINYYVNGRKHRKIKQKTYILHIAKIN